MSILVRPIQNCKAFEVVGEQSATVNNPLLEHRLNFNYEADGTFKDGVVALETGDNHIFTRNIQRDDSGYINSVTKFGPRVKGGKVLALSGKAASKNSAIVTGSIEDVPILPIAFVNSFLVNAVSNVVKM